ncbi:vegetative cell wall protein gp1-like [Miscanthus floridulus]|uniref:vegetative cell wall protein gp1-like n=1 Tax=Miscanthus floridulus TaxID=154761 RepID=UPI00345845A1
MERIPEMDPWLGARVSGAEVLGMGKQACKGASGAIHSGAELRPNIYPRPSSPSPCPSSPRPPPPAHARARPLPPRPPRAAPATPRTARRANRATRSLPEGRAAACQRHARAARAVLALQLRRPSTLLLPAAEPTPAPLPPLPRPSPAPRSPCPHAVARWLAAAPSRHALHRRPSLCLHRGGLGLAPPCPLHRRPRPALPTSTAALASPRLPRPSSRSRSAERRPPRDRRAPPLSLAAPPQSRIFALTYAHRPSTQKDCAYGS